MERHLNLPVCVSVGTFTTTWSQQMWQSSYSSRYHWQLKTEWQVLQHQWAATSSPYHGNNHPWPPNLFHEDIYIGVYRASGNLQMITFRLPSEVPHQNSIARTTVTFQLLSEVPHQNSIARATVTQVSGCLCHLGPCWSTMWVYLIMVWVLHLHTYTCIQEEWVHPTSIFELSIETRYKLNWNYGRVPQR